MGIREPLTIQRLRRSAVQSPEVTVLLCTSTPWSSA